MVNGDRGTYRYDCYWVRFRIGACVGGCPGLGSGHNARRRGKRSRKDGDMLNTGFTRDLYITDVSEDSSEGNNLERLGCLVYRPAADPDQEPTELCDPTGDPNTSFIFATLSLLYHVDYPCLGDCCQCSTRHGFGLVLGDRRDSFAGRVLCYSRPPLRRSQSSCTPSPFTLLRADFTPRRVEFSCG